MDSGSGLWVSVRGAAGSGVRINGRSHGGYCRRVGALEEVGPRISESIMEFFSRAANRELVQRLKDAGVDMTAEKKQRSAQLAD